MAAHARPAYQPGIRPEELVDALQMQLGQVHQRFVAASSAEAALKGAIQELQAIEAIAELGSAVRGRALQPPDPDLVAEWQRSATEAGTRVEQCLRQQQTDSAALEAAHRDLSQTISEILRQWTSEELALWRPQILDLLNEHATDAIRSLDGNQEVVEQLLLRLLLERPLPQECPQELQLALRALPVDVSQVLAARRHLNLYRTEDAALIPAFVDAYIRLFLRVSDLQDLEALLRDMLHLTSFPERRSWPQMRHLQQLCSIKLQRLRGIPLAADRIAWLRRGALLVQFQQLDPMELYPDIMDDADWDRPIANPMMISARLHFLVQALKWMSSPYFQEPPESAQDDDQPDISEFLLRKLLEAIQDTHRTPELRVQILPIVSTFLANLPSSLLESDHLQLLGLQEDYINGFLQLFSSSDSPDRARQDVQAALLGLSCTLRAADEARQGLSRLGHPARTFSRQVGQLQPDLRDAVCVFLRAAPKPETLDWCDDLELYYMSQRLLQSL